MHRGLSLNRVELIWCSDQVSSRKRRNGVTVLGCDHDLTCFLFFIYGWPACIHHMARHLFSHMVAPSLRSFLRCEARFISFCSFTVALSQWWHLPVDPSLLHPLPQKLAPKFPRRI
ncbi:hypothetical protein PAHAL_6G072200 [Panicum hallii]|uniref:Uncharacterized protein n=1 Tax=Panicum hallii TaxID=206008 RepID=A0A2T8IFI1_9POAL|nr:hypothetical protein PAHAL_6G072200 [Panicum hallii]